MTWNVRHFVMGNALLLQSKICGYYMFNLATLLEE